MSQLLFVIGVGGIQVSAEWRTKSLPVSQRQNDDNESLFSLSTK
jgi:hypothetical protein